MVFEPWQFKSSFSSWKSGQIEPCLLDANLFLMSLAKNEREEEEEEVQNNMPTFALSKERHVWELKWRGRGKAWSLRLWMLLPPQHLFPSLLLHFLLTWGHSPFIPLVPGSYSQAPISCPGWVFNTEGNLLFLTDKFPWTSFLPWSVWRTEFCCCSCLFVLLKILGYQYR